MRAAALVCLAAAAVSLLGLAQPAGAQDCAAYGAGCVACEYTTLTVMTGRRAGGRKLLRRGEDDGGGKHGERGWHNGTFDNDDDDGWRNGTHTPDGGDDGWRNGTHGHHGGRHNRTFDSDDDGWRNGTHTPDGNDDGWRNGTHGHHGGHHHHNGTDWDDDDVSPSPAEEASSPAPAAVMEASPAPAAAEEALPAPKEVEEASPAPKAVEEASPAPKAGDEALPAPKEVEEASPAPMKQVEETSPAPAAAESSPAPDKLQQEIAASKFGGSGSGVGSGVSKPLTLVNGTSVQVLTCTSCGPGYRLARENRGSASLGRCECAPGWGVVPTGNSSSPLLVRRRPGSFTCEDCGLKGQVPFTTSANLTLSWTGGAWTFTLGRCSSGSSLAGLWRRFGRAAAAAAPPAYGACVACPAGSVPSANNVACVAAP